MRLVAAAEAEVTTLTVEEAIVALASGALFVDIRDVREIKREGWISDSYHVPRGMLEFGWILRASIATRLSHLQTGSCCTATWDGVGACGQDPCAERFLIPPPFGTRGAHWV